MGMYGVFVIRTALWRQVAGTVPESQTMGAIGVAALAANGLVAVLLYAYRNGGANMRPVWLCTRNDAIGNVAVMVAALGVWQAGSGLPDLFVAGAMGVLALAAARSVIVRALTEMKEASPVAEPALIIEVKRR